MSVVQVCNPISDSMRGLTKLWDGNNCSKGIVPNSSSGNNLGSWNVIRLWLLLLDEGVGGDGIFVKMSVF